LTGNRTVGSAPARGTGLSLVGGPDAVEVARRVVEGVARAAVVVRVVVVGAALVVVAAALVVDVVTGVLAVLVEVASSPAQPAGRHRTTARTGAARGMV
jgi:hypothetical protein